MNIYIDSKSLGRYKVRSKLYQYLYSNLSTSYFKATSEYLSIYLKGTLGLFRVDIPCKSDTDEVKYFSIDFGKWSNALVKFEGCDGITLSINRNLVKISVDGSSDFITLSISSYGSDNLEVTSLDNLLEQRRENILKDDLCIEVTDEMSDDMYLANSLFIPQQDVNSIGLGKDGLIYAVRSVILKARFTNSIDEKFFNNLDPAEDYVYLHRYLVGLFHFIQPSNPMFYFSSDYSTMYWEDDTSAIYITQPPRELAIPSDEELSSFVPAPGVGGSFSVDAEFLKNSLGFFDGFYVGSVWKPIRFESIANKEVVVRYKHPTADITKALPSMSDTDGEFVLDSDTVRKILMKVRDKRLDKTEPLEATFTFDNEAPGVLCEIGNYYNIVFCKLNDDEDS